MLVIPPSEFRKRRGRPKRSAPATQPVALVLVSATLDLSGPSVTLAFDRAIDIAGIVPAQVLVDDAVTAGYRFAGSGTVVLVNAVTVQVELVDVGPSVQPGVHLDASAGTGIVAVDDGGTWGGVTNLELPFG